MKFFTPDQMTKESFNGKAICHFEIMKSETKEQDFDRLDGFMSELRDYVPQSRQKVLFSFAGYDTDKRELIYIPEVIRYTKAFISRHPYFWYYATPYNSEFFFLAILLDEKNHVIANVPSARKFHIKTDNEKVMNLVRVMGINLNIFGDEIDDIDGSVESLKVWSTAILEKMGLKLD
jgi:hypothetical protein